MSPKKIDIQNKSVAKNFTKKACVKVHAKWPDGLASSVQFSSVSYILNSTAYNL